MKPMLLALFAMSCSVRADWINLGFDDAITNSIQTPPTIFGYGSGIAAEMLPGWKITRGNEEITGIGLDQHPDGYGYATLYDTNSIKFGYVYPVEGKYAFQMVAGSDPIAIQQRGIIPTNTRTLQFTTYNATHGGLVDVYVNDYHVSLVTYDEVVDWGYPIPRQRTVALGDISQFAGQEVELRFVAETPPSTNPWHNLDSILFSTEAIPEPATGVLLLGGVLAIFAWRKDRRG